MPANAFMNVNRANDVIVCRFLRDIPRSFRNHNFTPSHRIQLKTSSISLATRSTLRSSMRSKTVGGQFEIKVCLSKQLFGRSEPFITENKTKSDNRTNVNVIHSLQK
jgi:hypothetical protein